MTPTRWMLALVAVVGLTGPVAVQEKGGQDETGPYDVVENWLKPLPNHDGWTFGPIGGVFAETPNRIFVVMRGEVAVTKPAPPGAAPSRPARRPGFGVFTVNGNGALIEAWTQWDKVFVQPHKIGVNPYDPERHIWVSDTAAHQIFKFTNDGKQLVMTLGEREVPGDDGQHFNQPADIAFFPDGSFLVADGYINARVAKFDKNGKFLMAWGSKGTGPGQFNLVHCVAIDAQRRVYVIDRTNHRIQVFDENGKFLEQWPNIRQATHLILTQDQHLWVSEGALSRILKYDLNGKLLTYWGASIGSINTPQNFPGALNNPHQFSVDPVGNLYVANYGGNTVKKFTPKPNADRSRLVGQPFGRRPS